jgi:hypothetical protein
MKFVNENRYTCGSVLLPDELRQKMIPNLIKSESEQNILI